MKESLLNQFVPPDGREEEIELTEELLPVLERISEVIPPDKIWELFSSSPSETGGRIVFPYSRVDAAVISSRDLIYILTNYNLTEEKLQENYRRASVSALEALTWVEIGFQGLENLAISPASKNWTSAVGHHVTDKERAIGIMTGGKKLYEGCLREFVRYRSQQGITNDCFTEYGLEYLLEPFLEDF